MTLLEVVLAMLSTLMVFGVLMLGPTKHYGQGFRCTSNLKQVGLAFRIWESDNNGLTPMGWLTNQNGKPLYTSSSKEFLYFQIMSNELSNPGVVICPDDKKRTGATNFTTDFNSRHVSYFVGLEATNDSFPQWFLAGDADITNTVPLNHGILYVTSNRPTGWTGERHKGGGNIVLADGSVQQLSTSGLNTAISQIGRREHLLMPEPPTK